MEPKINTPVGTQAEKVDQILVSVKKTEKYFKITLWITVAIVVLPLVALIVVVPMVIRSYLSALSGLL